MRTFAAGILIGLGLAVSPAAWAIDQDRSDTGLWHLLWQREGWSFPTAADPAQTDLDRAIDALGSGDIAQARRFAEAARQASPSAPGPLLVQALIEAGAKARPEAERLAREAVRLAPQSVLARMVLAEVTGDSRSADSSLPHWMIASELAPDQPLPLLKLGQALWAMGDHASARIAFQAVRLIAPQDARAAATIGSFYLQRHQTDEAISAFREAWALRPDDILLLQTLESIYLDQNRPGPVLALYEQAVLRRPQRWPLHYRLAGLTARYAPDQLPRVLARAERQFGHSANLLVQIGALATEGKLYGQAEQAFQRALRLDTRQVAAYTGLANLLLQTGRDDAAEATLQRAIQQAPDFAEGHHLLGVLALQRQNAPDALRYLEEAHRLNPAATQTNLALALAYRLAQLPERSIALLKDEANRHPRRPEVWLSLGDAHMEHKAYDEAMVAYKKATELVTQDADAFYALGNASSQAGRSAEAINAYHRSILLDPQHLDARNNLANIYLRDKQLNRAIDQLERLLTIEPRYATGYYNLACAYALQHEADQAFKLLTHAITLDGKLRAVAREDSDFDSVRDDDRFRQLVGDPAVDGQPASP